MNLLLDTHLLLWIAGRSSALSTSARDLIGDIDNTLWFSAASIWEVAIKRSLGRDDFKTDPSVLRAGLLANGYNELDINGRHTMAVVDLPKLHGDPFDRLLIAQSRSEGMILLTADKRVAEYGGPVRLV